MKYDKLCKKRKRDDNEPHLLNPSDIDNVQVDAKKQQKKKRVKQSQDSSPENVSGNGSVQTEANQPRKKKRADDPSDDSHQVEGKKSRKKKRVDQSSDTSPPDASNNDSVQVDRNQSRKNRMAQESSEPSLQSASDNNSVQVDAKQPRKKKKKHKIVQPAAQQANEQKVDDAKKKAIDYLQLWQNDRKSWSFMKIRQIWLLNNMHDLNQVKSINFYIYIYLVRQCFYVANDYCFINNFILLCYNNNGAGLQDGQAACTFCDSFNLYTLFCT